METSYSEAGGATTPKKEAGFLHCLLSRTSIAEIVPASHKLYFLNEDDSLTRALDLLTDHNVSSAPIIDSRGTFVRFVDNIDILHHLLKNVKSAVEFEAWRSCDFDQADEFESTVKDIAVRSKFEVPLTAKSIHSVDSLLLYFSEGFAHRCIVQPMGVVCSQTDLVRFLAKYIDDEKLDEVAQANVEDLVSYRPSPVTIGASEPVINAILKMVKDDVSCLGLVDEENGKLVGNFSASDLKQIRGIDLAKLYSSVKDYLAVYSPRSLEPRTVYETATVAKVIHTLVDNKVHRVWRIDLEGKPCGVITMTDVLKAIRTLQGKH